MLRKVAARLTAVLIGLSVCAGAVAQDIRFDTTRADPDTDATLRGASLLVALDAEGGASALDLIAAARADYRRLLTALYAQGYYGGTISILIDGREAAGIAPLDAPGQVLTIAVTVDPGLRFTFGQTDIGPLAGGTVLPKEFTRGQTARSDIVREAVAAAVAAWEEEGRAKAAPAGQDVTARHDAQVLDVRLVIDPGPVLTFGPLSVSGNVAVREDRIRRIAGLPKGQIYSPIDVARAEARLRRTGAFRAVALIESDDIGPGNTLDFEAQVVEQKPRRLGYGVEYSSVDGLSLSGYWMHRNLLGGAENLRFDARIAGLGSETGGVDYQLGATFGRPATFHVDTDLFATAQIERLDEPDYLLDQAQAEIGLRRIIGNDITVSGAIGVTTARVHDGLGTRGYTLLTLPLTGEIEQRDDPLDATSGYYLAIEATPFLGYGDAVSGGRIYGDGRVYRSLGSDDRLTLAFRGQVGSVIGPAAAAAPSDYLFYSGGGDTVRGQPYQSLGLDLGGGVSAGGLSFAAASVEARFDVSDKFGLVGFYDAGFVGPQALSMAGGDWHAGAGFGIRYETGIGPIRLDVATPASGGNAGQDVYFYVGIGQSF